MKNIAFTICTYSYYGLAFVLKKSFLKYHADFDFFIVIVDDILENQSRQNILLAENILSIDKATYEELAFKYTITEFCTSIKPFCFEYFFHNKYDFAVYLDPDIYFFSRFNEISNTRFSVILTPHILTMQDYYTGDSLEEDILKTGIFNAGFIALSNDNTGNNIIRWWKNRLINKAYNDPSNGLFTDQKWIDFIPSLIDANHMVIVRNSGCNVAPWNLFERKIIQKDNIYYINSRLNNKDIEESILCFFHFSGFSYNKLINGTISHTCPVDSKYPDSLPLIKTYKNKLVDNSAGKYLCLKCKYSEYDNGVLIQDYQRRLYRQLIENNITFTNLFSSNGEYYNILKKSKLLIFEKMKYHFIKNEIKYLSIKQKLLIFFFKLLFHLMGIKKYNQTIKALGHFSYFENHIFLLKKIAKIKNWDY